MSSRENDLYRLGSGKTMVSILHMDLGFSFHFPWDFEIAGFDSIS